jgi:hypothetical protein
MKWFVKLNCWIFHDKQIQKIKNKKFKLKVNQKYKPKLYKPYKNSCWLKLF